MKKETKFLKSLFFSMFLWVTSKENILTTGHNTWHTGICFHYSICGVYANINSD